MMDINTIVGALIGSGGILSVGGFIKYRDWRSKDRLLKEDTSITRLEKENIAARKRADEAEADEERAKKLADKWHEQAMLYKGMLIQAGLLKPGDTDDQ